jgi:hypothetical protein
MCAVHKYLEKKWTGIIALTALENNREYIRTHAQPVPSLLLPHSVELCSRPIALNSWVLTLCPRPNQDEAVTRSVDIPPVRVVVLGPAEEMAREEMAPEEINEPSVQAADGPSAAPATPAQRVVG